LITYFVVLGHNFWNWNYYLFCCF